MQPVRPWSKDKLGILGQYLSAYSTIMSNQKRPKGWLRGCQWRVKMSLFAEAIRFPLADVGKLDRSKTDLACARTADGWGCPAAPTQRLSFHLVGHYSPMLFMLKDRVEEAPLGRRSLVVAAGPETSESALSVSYCMNRYLAESVTPSRRSISWSVSALPVNDAGAFCATAKAALASLNGRVSNPPPTLFVTSIAGTTPPASAAWQRGRSGRDR